MPFALVSAVPVDGVNAPEPATDENVTTAPDTTPAEFLTVAATVAGDAIVTVELDMANVMVGAVAVVVPPVADELPQAADPVKGDAPASHPLLPHAASTSASAHASKILIILMKPAPAKSLVSVAIRLNVPRSARSRPWA
jgi:hypothetical protein